jgi:hypothetical protein
LYFDREKKCFSSFVFEIKEKEDVSDKGKDKVKDISSVSVSEGSQVSGITFNNLQFNIQLIELMKLNVWLRIENKFTQKW